MTMGHQEKVPGHGLSLNDSLKQLTHSTKTLFTIEPNQGDLWSITLYCSMNDWDIREHYGLKGSVDRLIQRSYGHLIGPWEPVEMMGRHCESRLFEYY